MTSLCFGLIVTVPAGFFNDVDFPLPYCISMNWDDMYANLSLVGTVGQGLSIRLTLSPFP